jgi:hypothetical protein
MLLREEPSSSRTKRSTSLKASLASRSWKTMVGGSGGRLLLFARQTSLLLRVAYVNDGKNINDDESARIAL